MKLPDPVHLLKRGATALSNLIADLPGERPAWVTLDLQGAYPAREQPRRLLAVPPEVGPRDPSLEQLELQIEALARAPWLEGVLVRFGPTSFGPARAWAVRRLLRELSAEKRVVAYLAYPSLLAYWVATAADEVVLTEAEVGGGWGLGAETVYWGKALERAGVSFERVRVREYKTAFENVARGSMSEEQREQVGAILADIDDAIVSEIARGRSVEEEMARGWLEQPPTGREDAVERGLIDRSGYEDDAVGDEPAQLPQVARFLKRRPPAWSGRVAVVSLAGAIVPGESRRSPLPLPLIGGTFAGSETQIRALRTAAKDPRVEAVVFHVESPGGSALASDLIWREVQQLARSKPVVAVMGDVAGSGGYYVLTHATRVIAAPTTVTGSIGVIAGKFVVEELFDRFGVRAERVTRHRFAHLMSSAEPFDDEERAFLEANIQATYSQFIRRVADGRDLALERVDEIGRGRIWSGRAAQELGLVDELGDVRTAIARAKALAGLPDDAPVVNVRPPRHRPAPLDLEDASHLLARLRGESSWALMPGGWRVLG